MTRTSIFTIDTHETPIRHLTTRLDLKTPPTRAVSCFLPAAQITPGLAILLSDLPKTIAFRLFVTGWTSYYDNSDEGHMLIATEQRLNEHFQKPIDVKTHTWPSACTVLHLGGDQLAMLVPLKVTGEHFLYVDFTNNPPIKSALAAMTTAIERHPMGQTQLAPSTKLRLEGLFAYPNDKRIATTITNALATHDPFNRLAGLTPWPALETAGKPIIP